MSQSSQSSKESQALPQNLRLFMVDDDEGLRLVLRQQFESDGLSAIEEAGLMRDIWPRIDEFKPDIVLLDVQLPDGNGFDICRRLRESGFEKPILMLTGQDSESDIIQGLEAGANDYIAKPMRMGELLARMRTHLRQHKLSDDVRFDICGLDFVPAQKTISSPEMNSKIILTEKETMVLKMLTRQAPHIVSKDDMLADIWGFQKGLATHTLETHIYRLRQKLTRLTADPIIETALDGYRLADRPDASES